MGMHQMLGPSFGASEDYVINRGLRFNSTDDTYLFFNPSGHGNRKVFTFSFWVKRATLGTSQLVLYVRSGAGNTGRVRFDASDRFEVESEISGSAVAKKVTTAKFRDCSAWQHFVVKFDAVNTNCDIYHNGVELTAFDTNTEPTNVDHYFGGDYSHYLGGFADTESVDGYLAEVHMVNGQALAASDFGEFNNDNVWQPKKYTGTYGTNGFFLKFADNSSNAALGTDSSGNSNTWTVYNLIAGQYSPTATSTGDPTSSTDSPFSSGYSVDFDGNDSLRITGPGTITGDFTAECFIKSSSYGGIQRFFSADQASQSGERLNLRAYQGNTEFYVAPGVSASGTNLPTNQWNHVAITRSGSTVSYYLNGSRWATDTHSAAISVTTFVVAHGFGSEYFTGKVSNARFVDGQALYTGSSYTQPTATLTTTSQGAIADNVRLICCHQSSVTAAQGTLSAAADIDSLIDTPTNYEADSGNNGGNYCTFNPLVSNGTLSNGNLDVTTNLTGDSHTHGTIAFPSSGKWYYEITPTAQGNQAYIYIGDGAANVANSVLYYGNDGRKRVDGTFSTYGATYGNGDVIGVAVNVDDGEVTFYKNGSSQGAISYTISGKTLFPAVADGSSGAAVSFSANWGQRPFSQTVPTGFKSLCTQNLPDPPIADGSTAFDAKLWTGDGSSSRAITSYSFSPDFVWIKIRNDSYGHAIFDIVRGANVRLDSVGTNADQTITDGLLSFDSNGFTIGNRNTVGENNKTYVGWAWDGGTSTASNTDGSITTSVRASAAKGFSICTYTGNGTDDATFGHGLNAAPAFIIIKRRDSADDWFVYSLPTANNILKLNATDAKSGSSHFRTMSSSTFQLSGNADVNANNGTFVAYCFAPVAGYSAFGSYEGNGSANGPFVYTGMRPAFILVKNADSADDWCIADTTRSTHNVQDETLFPNTAGGEDTGSFYIDILSNGFKPRNTTGKWNSSGKTFVYAAFAEHPQKTSRAR